MGMLIFAEHAHLTLRHRC